MTDSDNDSTLTAPRSEQTSEADDFDDDSFWTAENQTNDATDQNNDMENLPTKEEIELWKEVRGILDSEEPGELTL